ncbi:hypothetical protein [Pararhodospirillum oryzae]|uniref:Uncharacterized protein n=1 Tax=Pararhodospirillum oryzae TaxID=478448 RepID=A0A512H695_9PROT|nr:hypothetical protein [Pararhodospirillum oryzae]GEO80967.1 hypothetical protein ROR02_10980 [Pararhodospirillum oryzae]
MTPEDRHADALRRIEQALDDLKQAARDMAADDQQPPPPRARPVRRRRVTRSKWMDR